MVAYYNEIDPNAAAWLRELIRRNLIAPGDVDERSIVDVRPGDLTRYTQCHFFAGIGVWSLALRMAGWADDRPAWTGSCPCQPFSSAGKQRGFDDERHLWPEFYRLISERRPPVVFGEQVAAKAGLGWLDTVFADLEGSGYSCGAADLCAAGVGAPHIRQRLFWVAESAGDEWGQVGKDASRSRGGGEAEGLGQRLVCSRPICLAHTESQRRDGGQDTTRPDGGHRAKDGGYTRGFWSGADWLYCRDGKLRPVEPGTFPLVNGAPARVGRLRGYGNSIVAPLAEAFVSSYLDTL